MSLLQLLTDVIEEVYISERSLDPGDIPDQTIFKHVRSLWHLLLGIDENKYDAHNYELLELSFNSNEYKFACFIYLGSDFDNIAESVPHSIGFPQESLKVVELLDNQLTEENTEDESISFKLSMLNQIRFILFNHHIMVDKLIVDDQVERVLAKYLTIDINNDANEDTLSFNSNNEMLNMCYSWCYSKFVLGESDLGIDEISREILETFKYEATVAFFFNHSILTDYHNKMVDVLKRIYRKHDFVDVEIDDYFRHNPILPILKPVYRKLALQTYDEDLRMPKNNCPGLKERIGIALLKQILVDLSTAELKSVLVEMPISLKRFPLVVNYYIESLISSGVKLIENDPFIQMIELCILKWVNKEVDNDIFVTQLCELSTIPTAEPYKYKDTIFPNVHMRMAVFMVRQNIRIYETYFKRWKNKHAQYHKILKAEKNVEIKLAQKYYSIWKYKYQKVKVISHVSLHTVETPILKLYFQKWIRKETIIQTNMVMADNSFIKKFFFQIQTLKTVYFSKEKQAISFSRACLLKKVFTLWVSRKEKRFPQAYDQFIIVKKRTIINFMKNVAKTYQQRVSTANLFYKNTLTHQYYTRWKTKAKRPLLLLKEMEHKANVFIVQQKFIKWRFIMSLNQKEKNLKAYFDHQIMRKIFSKWLHLKHLLDLENQLARKLYVNQCRYYFAVWSRMHHLSLKAESYFCRKTLIVAFKKWKLETTCYSFEKKMLNTTGRNCFHIWALKATEKQYTASRKYILLLKTFVSWSEKTMFLAQKSEYNLLEVNAMHLSTYFQFWKKVTVQIENMNLLGETYLKNKLRDDELILKRKIFERLKVKNRESRLKRLELNRIERSFGTYLLKKFMSKWKKKYSKISEMEEHAIFYRKILYETHYYDQWLAQFDRILQLKNILLSKLDSDSIDLLNKIISKLQILMVKIHTDETKATRFKRRWDRIRLKTFFELWKLKQNNRTSPTPTARANYSSNSYSNDAIPELNPYIDLAPRDRGSPEYKGPFRPQFTSILSGQATQFEISASIGESQTPITSRNTVLESTYKTPMMRRIASKSNNHASIRLSPDKAETNITESVKRARQRHIEERLSMYRLLRPPPSTHKQKLSAVSESSSSMFDGGSIFDTPNDSLISSTPIKNSGSHRISD